MNKNLITLPGRSHIHVIKEELNIIKRRYNTEYEKLQCYKAAKSPEKS